jgi:hypothetical protein
MKQTLILVSGDLKEDDYKKYHTGWVRCLGHEIHVVRIIIIDMLIKNKINANSDIIVTKSDRQFLYTDIFKNVITYEEYRKLNRNDYNFIPMIMYAGHYISRPIDIEEFKQIDYTFLNTYYTEEFKKYCNKISYINLQYSFLTNKFIIIHHRFNESITKLNKIIDIVKNSCGMQIIIFNNDINKLKQQLLNDSLIFVDNLQEYASLLHHNNCSGLISECSGGGQLSQYTSTAKLFSYYDKYQYHYNPKMIESEREKDAMTKIIGPNYDFKCITNAIRKYYKNYDEFIINIETELRNL